MSNQTVHKIGIIMNGVTGRMGLNQHLIRSILAPEDSSPSNTCSYHRFR